MDRVSYYVGIVTSWIVTRCVVVLLLGVWCYCKRGVGLRVGGTCEMISDISLKLGANAHDA